MRDPLHFLPIRFKLPLAFLLIGVLVLGVGGLLMAGSASSVVSEQIGVLLTERASTTALLLEQELAVLARRIEDFASDGYIRTGLAASLAGDEPAPRDGLLRHLVENKLPLVTSFVGARLRGPDGQVVLATDEWPEEPSAATDAGTRFGPFRVGEGVGGGGAFTLSTPVFALEGGRRIGRLEILVAIGPWLAGFRVPGSLGGDGAYRVSLRDGADGRISLTGDGPLPAAGGEKDRMRFAHELEPSGYRVLVTADRAAFLGPLEGLSRRFLLIGGGVLIALTVVAFFPVHFILRPLEALRTAARRIADGELTARVEAQARDEIGELSDAFNEMAEAILERNRRLTEAADRQAHQERLSVLGEITAVIAHELSNPLAAIAMFGQMLEAGLPDDSPLREHAEVIRRNAEIGKKTIRGMLDMAATPTAQSEEFDVHETLEDALRLLRPIWQRADAAVELVKRAEQSLIYGDELQLRQAVVNLVMNAIQASSTRITVDTADAGDDLVIRVVDDGPGIPPAARERIFDSFFTTKPPGVGTGLGLPTARRIAAAHSGSLELVESAPGRTVFELRLPRNRSGRPVPVWRGGEVADG